VPAPADTPASIGAVRHQTGWLSDRRRARSRLERVARRLPPRRVSWKSLSSSSLSSSCWQSPVDHCWPCATLQRLTSSPQEPIQRTSRARSQTPARAPPPRPHPGTPKTNRRRLGDPLGLRLAWRVTTLRTGRSSGSWAATGNPPRVASRPRVCPGAAAAAGPAVAAGFYALATARRRRSLHPTGTGYQGWLQIPHQGPARPDVPSSRPAQRIRPCFASPGVPACPSRSPTP
jgi:hypothetical protein